MISSVITMSVRTWSAKIKAALHRKALTLNSQARILAVRAEGDPFSDCVGETDGVREHLEDVHGQADPLGRFAVHDLEDLRHFHDGAEDDDTEAKRFGYGQSQAERRADIDIVDQSGVAFLECHRSSDKRITRLAQEASTHVSENCSRRIPDDAWKVVGDFLDSMLPTVCVKDHLGVLCRS